ncbi:MAG: ATP-binding protein [Legionellaceae bacterium]|nr:ATP-binding protein [Legionellaceae bacterium]
MDKSSLRQIIIDQQRQVFQKRAIPRDVHNKLLELTKINQVVIITGIRRCGKSTELQLIREQLPEKNYYLNFDDERLLSFKVEDFQILYEVFIELYGEQQTFYFDEIQNVPDWERFIRRLHDQGNKVFITGSNASMFSSELGTRLTGRHVTLRMHPFSFKEFVLSKTGKNSIEISDDLTTTENVYFKTLFNEYISQGGFPEYITNNSQEYLISLYNNIIYRDIITRYKINNEKALRELSLYLSSNVGKDVSYNKLKKMLGLGSTTTVSEYCEYLSNSFLCFFINRYDYSLKKQLASSKKAYFIDSGLSQAIGFRFSDDYGRFLENSVFLELSRQEHTEIYFHRDKYECDFITRQGKTITSAIQVCQHIHDGNKERELNGVVEAAEKYKLKNVYLLTEDETETITNEHFTIHILPTWKWMLNLKKTSNIP